MALPKRFEQAGYAYEQVQCGARCAIYKRQKEGHVNAEYEVIIVQHKKERMLPSGSLLPAGEYYPSSSQWGAYGKTTLNLERTKHLYNVGERDGRFNAES